MKNKILLAFLIALVFGLTAYQTSGAGQQNNSRMIILCYHHLVEEGEPADGSTLTVGDFAAQMAYLYENNYNVLSIEEFLKYYEQKKFPEKSVLLTFDDGYQSFYNLAYPILKKYNFEAVIFPVVSLTPGLERQVVWNKHLTFYQMRVMLKDSDLIHIGNHSYNLHYYRDDGMPAIERKAGEKEKEYIARIKQDLRLSKDLLELQTDQEVICLAWPYGRTNQTAVNIAKELGYQLLFTLRPEPVTPNTSLHRLPRYGVTSGSLEDFKKILANGSGI